MDNDYTDKKRAEIWARNERIRNRTRLILYENNLLRGRLG